MAAPTTARAGLLGVAAVCIAAVAAALVAQYGFGMQPCPWCILQRLIYLAIALSCIVGALLGSRAAQRGFAGLGFVLAGCGVASAIWQHVVAAKQFSCNLTLADNIITALKLESLVPPLFQVTATCADAAVSLLGVPFEYWSLLLFALIGIALATLALRPATR
jgi:disulfide bond formation protein DsbB